MKIISVFQSTAIVAVFLGVMISSDSYTNTLDSIYHQTYFRKFIVHPPTGYDGSEPLPVVFVLHGGSGGASSTIKFSQMDKVADNEGFLAVFPEGYAETQMGGHMWADARSGIADKMGIDDVGFIRELIDTLDDRWSIDVNRVYVTGISNGGFMTARLACELSDKLAAVAIVCASMDIDYFPLCNPSQKISVMILNGTEDPLVPYVGGLMNSSGRKIISTDTLFSFWLAQNGCLPAVDTFNYPNSNHDDNSTVTRYVYNDCDCNSKVALYKVLEGGHTWPGVENKRYEIIAGETNEDIHASEEIWKFCSQFSLGCTSAGSQKWMDFPRKGLQVNPNTSSPHPNINVYLYSLSGKLINRSSLRNVGTLRKIQMSKGIYIQLLKQGSKTFSTPYLHR